MCERQEKTEEERIVVLKTGRSGVFLGVRVLTALSAFAMGIWIWLELYGLLPMGVNLSPRNMEVMRFAYKIGFCAGFVVASLVFLGVLALVKEIRELIYSRKEPVLSENLRGAGKGEGQRVPSKNSSEAGGSPKAPEETESNSRVEPEHTQTEG